VQIRTNNSLWVKGGTIKPPFKEQALNIYQFQTYPLESTEKVNEWVSKCTNGTMKRCVEMMDPHTSMLCVSTTCIDGKWKHAFDPKKTIPDMFTGFDGKSRECKMMFQNDPIGFMETPLYTACTKDYGDNYEAVMVLPKKPGKEEMINVINSCKNDPGSFSPDKLVSQNVDLYCPIFDLESGIDLTPCLKKMGVTRCFTKEAQFGNLCTESCHLTSTIHKCSLRCNETGTTQTGGVLPETITRNLMTLCTMKCDRPFLMIIRHKKTQTMCCMAMIQTC